MTESQQLLARYVSSRSESAFRELLTRYLDLVYSTAVRMVDGDTHRAEDVSQIVFADLARMADKLSPNTLLGGWLHRHTCFVCRNLMRSERRRQVRERQAVEMNSLNAQTDQNLAQLAPILDEAIHELGPDYRDAILLRFFERCNLRSVGEALGISENVAQKRVSRALDELETLLKQKGVTLSAAALAGCLGAAAVSAAPLALASTIAGSIFSGTATTAGLAAATAKAAAVTKLKLGIVAAMLFLWVSVVIFLQTPLSGRSSRTIQSTSIQTDQPRPEGTRRPAQTRQEFVPAFRDDTFATPQRSAAETVPTAVATVSVVAPVTNSIRHAGGVAGPPGLFNKKTRLDAKTGSDTKVRIQGTSTLHDWQVEGPLIGGFMEVGPGFPYGPELTNQPGSVFARAEAFVPVRSLKSVEKNGSPYSDKMNEIMFASLDVQKHPKISYYLSELTFIGTTNDHKALVYQFESRGDLVVAKATNEIEMPLSMQQTQPRRFKIHGTADLSMTSFGIEPDMLMPGIMKVADNVALIFDWVVVNKEQEK